MRTTRFAAAGLLLSTGLLAGCNAEPDPCATLPAPTQAEQEASRTSEVERELRDGSVECLVVEGDWVNAALLDD